MTAPPHTPAVLILADDNGVRRLLDGLTQQHGFTPVHAANAAAAIVTADEHLVDAFVLDLPVLGDHPGLEVLAWLRRHPRYRLTPVFVLTGAVNIGENERTLIKQHWAFVFHKRHSLQVLMEYIKRVLGGLDPLRRTRPSADAAAVMPDGSRRPKAAAPSRHGLTAQRIRR
jgi:CheY-like chemotaxis protein